MQGKIGIAGMALVAVTGWHVPLWAEPLSQGRAIISPVAKATLSAELASVVKEMPFAPGAEFLKGGMLVRLDCRLFDAQTGQAAAEFKIARLRADNAAELAKRNSIGRVEAEVAAQEYAKRAAAERVARLNTERCDIHAPFDGRVASWQVQPHERAEPGMPLLKIVGTDHFEVEIVAGTDWIGRIGPGDPITLELDHSVLVAQASVRAFAPEMDPVSQTVTVHAEIDETDGLLGGMTGTAIARTGLQVAKD